MNQGETVFTEGLRVFKMHGNAPTWMKCELVFNLAEFTAWAQRHVGADGSVRATVCASQKGGLYAKLNDWKPSPRAQEQSQGYVTPQQYEAQAQQQRPYPSANVAPTAPGPYAVAPPEQRTPQAGGGYPQQEQMDDVPF